MAPSRAEISQNPLSSLKSAKIRWIRWWIVAGQAVTAGRPIRPTTACTGTGPHPSRPSRWWTSSGPSTTATAPIIARWSPCPQNPTSITTTTTIRTSGPCARSLTSPDPRSRWAPGRPLIPRPIICTTPISCASMPPRLRRRFAHWGLRQPSSTPANTWAFTIASNSSISNNTITAIIITTGTTTVRVSWGTRPMGSCQAVPGQRFRKWLRQQVGNSPCRWTAWYLRRTPTHNRHRLLGERGPSTSAAPYTVPSGSSSRILGWIFRKR